MAGSIYRLQGTESRKGNISFSLDTQNATSVGGHRLQTEISSYSCSFGREGSGIEGMGEEEIKTKPERQEENVLYLTLAQKNMKRYCFAKEAENNIEYNSTSTPKTKKSSTINTV